MDRSHAYGSFTCGELSCGRPARLFNVPAGPLYLCAKHKREKGIARKYVGRRKP